jgi:polysaccharide biosynthesis protein PelF
MSADISVVLEGTWPLRTGGVARWLDALIRGLPDYTFAVSHLYSGDRCAAAFLVPENVSEVRYIDVGGHGPLPELDLAREIPDGRVIHALSSGEAGWLAAEASRRRGRPLVVTEHGLAWREAAAGCGELESGRKLGVGDEVDVVDSLLDAARSTYAAAAVITTVSWENVWLQREVGARLESLRVIENWVDDGVAVPVRDEVDGMHIGMVCRIVPMKDVLGFVDAAMYVVATDPSARFTIVGPETHDAEYALKVRRSIAERGLAGSVVMVGEQDPDDWWPTFDIVALSSVSEAQPLVLLEAMARGLPVVTTDVGGCRALVGGQPPAGEVVPARDPEALGAALLRLGAAPSLRREFGRNGRAITRSWHTKDRILGEYRRVYENASVSRRRTTAADMCTPA